MVDKKIKYNSPKNENFKTLCVLNKRKQVCTKLLHPNNPINFQVSRKWNDNEVLWAPREEYNNFGSISNIVKFHCNCHKMYLPVSIYCMLLRVCPFFSYTNIDGSTSSFWDILETFLRTNHQYLYMSVSLQKKFNNITKFSSFSH